MRIEILMKGQGFADVGLQSEMCCRVLTHDGTLLTEVYNTREAASWTLENQQLVLARRTIMALKDQVNEAERLLKEMGLLK